MPLKNEINVLHIEDDEDFIALVKTYLSSDVENLKFNIIYKNTLKSALEYLKNECLDMNSCGVDVVLLDLVLSDSKGLNAFEKIKEQCSFLPVVIVSGFKDLACECVRLGAQDYLIKPIIPKDLLIRSMQYAIERKKLEIKYRQSEDMSQKYLDIAGVMFVVLDKNQKVIMVNKKTSEILGYSQDEIVGKNWFKNFLPKSDISKIEKIYNDVLADKMDLVEYHENSVLTRDGTERMIAWHNSLLKDENGNVINTLSSGEDITKRKQAEEQLKKSEEALQEKEKEVYADLENKIRDWKTEITEKDSERTEQLAVINDSISSLNVISKE